MAATSLPLPHRAFPAVDYAAPPLRVTLDHVRVDTSSSHLRFKTTARQLYDEARARVGCAHVSVPPPSTTAVAPAAAAVSPAAPPGPFDVLLVNAHGELTEAGIANVALDTAYGRPWSTPPLSCGLVDGVMRRELLDCGRIVETVVTVEQLMEVVAAAGAVASHELPDDGDGWRPRVYCFNAVRGIYEVVVDVSASTHCKS